MNWKILAIGLVTFSSLSAQKKDCKCFNPEEYQKFVASEKHQTVIEGEPALFTLLLNRVLEDDVIVTYKVISGSATINQDFYSTETGEVTIAKGKTKGFIKIPTVKDHTNEGEETFTLELLEGKNARTGKLLNNNKLIRTRTIVDNFNSDAVQVYEKNGTFYSLPTYSDIEVRNINGELIPNSNLTTGTYFVKITIEGEVIKKQILVQ